MELVPTILYEDDDILAINKPAGLVVHADGKTDEPSVAEWFVEKYPASANVGEPIIKNDQLRITNDKLIRNSQFIIPNSVIQRPGIVHRIDRETSGVLLLAKTREGHAHLKKQFQSHEIEKIYRLFVYGAVKDDLGTINLPIARSASDFRKWSAQRGSRGEKREALTYYKVLKRSSDKSSTFLEAKPRTGRTHQIRVHFKAIHHPVVCDKLYAQNKKCLLGFQRLALHAFAISFTNLRGEKVVVEAPYPNDFLQAIDIIGYNVLD